MHALGKPVKVVNANVNVRMNYGHASITCVEQWDYK